MDHFIYLYIGVKSVIGYRRPKILQDTLDSSDLPELTWLSGKKEILYPEATDLSTYTTLFWIDQRWIDQI